jgi:putative holliday junction resolvase
MPLPITIIWIAVEFQNISGGARILALDLGKKRIGLALSDPLGITAQGLTTLQRTTIREDMAALKELCKERDVTLILMGNPLHMSGDESRQSAYTKEFGERLALYTGIPIRYWDERWTSVEAERVLKESGISIEKRAKAVDRLAAVILLESYLDAQRLATPQPQAHEEHEPTS